MEETKEELPNFTFSFEDDLAVFQASKSNELQLNQKAQIVTVGTTVRSVSSKISFHAIIIIGNAML